MNWSFLELVFVIRHRIIDIFIKYILQDTPGSFQILLISLQAMLIIFPFNDRYKFIQFIAVLFINNFMLWGFGWYSLFFLSIDFLSPSRMVFWFYNNTRNLPQGGQPVDRRWTDGLATTLPLWPDCDLWPLGLRNQMVVRDKLQPVKIFFFFFFYK